MEEKIITLKEILSELKGERVWLVHSTSPDGEARGQYVIIGKITPSDGFEYWTAGDNDFGLNNNYIGNIREITKSHVDTYRNDEESVIYYTDGEQPTKTR